jgi:hypothetical protein
VTERPVKRPTDPAGRRLYELRLTRIVDAALRDRLARWLVNRFPPRETEATRAALGGAGLVINLPLSDAEAPGLMRELYAAGVPPAALVLVPADLVGPRGEPESAVDAAFALFEARGGRFAPTWNWAAFLLGPLWYLRKGLYGKGVPILALTVYPLWPLPITVVVSLGLFAYCGIVGNYDYYLLRVKRTQWW